ncbi:MAG TPA: PilZ domain-containing protein [Nitrospiraceae bacterium]|nr:PilZ domain-containing protein [Nitrospiraceae bacterium]
MEQRKFERFSISGNVTFSGDSVRGEGRIDNLSLGGAAITSDVSVAKGDYLQLTMLLATEPRARAIEVELAPVRWIKDHSFGVEFIRVNPSALQILQHFVEHLGPVPHHTASPSL